MCWKDPLAGIRRALQSREEAAARKPSGFAKDKGEESPICEAGALT